MLQSTKQAMSIALLASLAIASPIGLLTPGARLLNSRQAAGSNTQNDHQNGQAPCSRAILIFARASTETGNIGSSAGPALTRALESTYGEDNIWVQGVGGPYAADIADAELPGGTTQAAIGEAVRLFNLAQTTCPDTTIVVGGYSQGSAIIAGAITRLSSTIRTQVRGTVPFGYSQNQQNNGGVPNYPSSNLRVYCDREDLVCQGTKTVTPAHLMYEDEAAGPAADFLRSRIG